MMEEWWEATFNISLLDIFLMLDDIFVQQLPSTSEFAIYIFEERKNMNFPRN